MSQKPRNPFEHHHSHGPADDVPFEELDPAQQSVADALRISFWLLKVVMLIVVVFYLFSGIYSVPTGQRAIRLRFGAIVGEPGQQVIDSGGLHWSWPYPFEEVLMVPAGEDVIRVESAFWPELQEGQTLDNMRGGELNPERDGSLITADVNIMHARWTVSYRVGTNDQGLVDSNEVIKFIQNIGNVERGREMVRAAVEQGAVFAAAQVTAEQLYQGKEGDYEAARVRAQQALDAMESGIRITSLSLSNKTPPIEVRDAFRLVLEAENERTRLLQEAEARRTNVLNEMAGAAHAPLLRLIDEYETATEDRRAQIDRTLDEAFRQLSVSEGESQASISGQVARMIQEARAQRVRAIQEMESQVNTFQSLLAGYRATPHVFLNSYWQEAMREILGSRDVETFYLPTGAWPILEMDRDPEVKARKERERNRRLDEERLQRGQSAGAR